MEDWTDTDKEFNDFVNDSIAEGMDKDFATHDDFIDACVETFLDMQDVPAGDWVTLTD